MEERGRGRRETQQLTCLLSETWKKEAEERGEKEELAANSLSEIYGSRPSFRSA